MVDAIKGRAPYRIGEATAMTAALLDRGLEDGLLGGS